jgi:hypothetical protein
VRRLMLLLSLISVLVGTPLRLAEAADDLARSLAESDNGVNIEQVDGGVGDDSGATIKPEITSSSIAPTSGPMLLVLDCLELKLDSGSKSFRPHDRLVGGSIYSGRTCAWLQRFLC